MWYKYIIPSPFQVHSHLLLQRSTSVSLHNGHYVQQHVEELIYSTLFHLKDTSHCECCPTLLVALTSAPDLINISTTWTWPLSAAACRGVVPCCVWLLCCWYSYSCDAFRCLLYKQDYHCLQIFHPIARTSHTIYR